MVLRGLASRLSRGLRIMMAGLSKPVLLSLGIVMLLAYPAAGHVSVTFMGSGGSSGDAVLVTVKKTSSAPKGELTLTLPAGSRLTNARASEQNMVVGAVRGRLHGHDQYSPESTIRVSGTEPITYVLDAYCADFAKDNPSESTSFALSQPDQELACLLKETQNRSVATRQATVWIKMDRITFTQMNEKFPVSTAEWADAEKAMTRCQGNSPRP